MRWTDRWLAGGWVAQAQLLAIGVLGMAVLLPFAMAAGLLALAAAIVLIGPIGLVRLVRRGEAGDRVAASRAAGPPCVPEP
jgi:hypothetical protein